MAWVKDYLDEAAKHKGQDVSQLGLGIGKKYLCSRPPGLLTAHGYIRRQVDELRQQTAPETGDASGAMKNNRAFQEFVRRHCRSQREKGKEDNRAPFDSQPGPGQGGGDGALPR